MARPKSPLSRANTKQKLLRVAGLPGGVGAVFGRARAGGAAVLRPAHAALRRRLLRAACAHAQSLPSGRSGRARAGRGLGHAWRHRGVGAASVTAGSRFPSRSTSGRARAGCCCCSDGVGNPHNLGAIARTAAFFAVPRMVLSDHPAQAGPSDASYRAGAGLSKSAASRGLNLRKSNN
jgi:hypothetical protein